MTARMLIVIYPPEMFRDPRVIEVMRREELPSPISIEHSLATCLRCGRKGWIGPKQRAAADADEGEIWCFYCLSKIRGALSAPVVALNPDADSIPRRFGAAPRPGES